MNLEKCNKQLKNLNRYKNEALNEIKKYENKIEKDRRDIKRYIFCLMISIMSLALIVSCIFVAPMREFALNLLKIDLSQYVILSLDTLKLLGIYIGWCVLQAVLMAISIEYDELSDTIGIALLAGVFSYIYFIKEYPITFISSNKKGIKRYKKRYEEILLEIEQAEKTKVELEKTKNKAEEVYKKAIENNDEELMKEAADLGDERAVTYFETKAAAEKAKMEAEKAEEFYNNAHGKEKVNRNILEKAAKLGHEVASIEMARYLIDDYCSDEYTAEEKVELIKKSASYLENVDKTNDIELEFLWIFSKSMYDWVNDVNLMKKALSRIREIKNSGELQEKYQNLASVCASTLVNFIDKTGSFKEEPKVSRTEEVKFDPSKVVCRYFANGICGYKSSSMIIEHCYRDDGTWKICPHYKNRVY